MPSFGEKLRRERESRNSTLEEVARTTKIQLSYLEALEQNDFEALPGRAFGKLYIRAYAEVLGFDPENLIADYDRAGPGKKVTRPLEAQPQEPRNAWQAALRENRLESQRARQGSLRTARPRPLRQEREEPTEADRERPVDVEPMIVTSERQEPSAPRRHEPGSTAESEVVQRSWWTARTLTLVSSGLLAALALMYFGFSRTDVVGNESPVGAAPPSDMRRDALTETSKPPTDPSRAANATASTGTPPPELTADTPGNPGRLTVAGHGVGRRVVHRRLEGRSDRFEEGSVAWFSTRVLGGKPGQAVHHVWLREGKRVQSIELELGGPHWRTHSSKTLWGVGSWAVEARDVTGRVLARAEFDCVAASS